ncbi:MAG: class I SAM-dependent methyltransferase [Candidatus Auribacterota bacterium]
MKSIASEKDSGCCDMKKVWRKNQDKIAENHRNLAERFEYYLKFGVDRALLTDETVEKIDFMPGRIIEIGSGKGNLTAALAKKFGSVLTIDIDEANLYMAYLNAAYEQVEQRVEFILSSAECLAYDDGAFDLSISTFSFHHFEKPFRVLDEMMRVTHKTLIISDFNAAGFAIIDRIHESEGRIHEKKSNDFSIAGAYLKYKGFDVREYNEQWQKIYVAEKRS